MSRERPVRPGDVLLAAIAENIPPGSEQQGARPVVVVANPATSTGPQRFDVIVIVPLTTATGPWATANPVLYPPLEPGQGGLPQRSTALLDHIQALDVKRVRKFYGSLDADGYQPIAHGLEQMFDFDGGGQ